jgi:hypothetical protein
MNEAFRLLLPALAALGACATTSLTPGPGAVTLPGTTNVATDRIDGVTVTAQADAWHGSGAVADAVQPVLVTIENDGERPIRVRYGDFALVAPGGRRYSALPPFRVEGEITRPVVARVAIVATPRFRHQRFYVAPYFSVVYPGMPVYRGHYLFYDPFYYGFYHPHLRVRPSADMLDLALPEGVIEPGGSVSGFLYFERVDPEVPAVTFRATLVALGTGEPATGGAMFGEISIPFTVTTKDWP